MHQASLVTSIKLALSGIVALAALSMAISYWISNSSDSDAHAINLVGSLRMQTYRLALIAQTDPTNSEALAEARATFEETWRHPLVQSLQHQSAELEQNWTESYDFFVQQHQALHALPLSVQLPLLNQQVQKLEKLVENIQLHSEVNAQKLRLVQIISLFSILVLAGAVIYWLRIRMEQPLLQLKQMTSRIGQGDFKYRITPSRIDELGVLAQTFNQMSDSISHMHSTMVNEIEQQTAALQRSNTTLRFLYDTAKTIIEQESSGINYEPILTQLQSLADVDDIELCLITEAGDTPYRQVKPQHSETNTCAIRECSDCLSGVSSDGQVNQLPNGICRYTFPMNRDQNHYGVLVVRTSKPTPPEPWQQQLLQSVADQIAMALSLHTQEDNARRLSLARERTVIARELHDSLAQALSYLKIQVTRLNRGLAKDDKAVLEDVSKELHDGLSTAYQQLRELLTTFRLKMDTPGLLGSLQSSVEQFTPQTKMKINLDYQLANVPLTPNEEIHVLQIIREAVQNALHHSDGTHVDIEVKQHQQHVRVSIHDDGTGITEHPQKLNHYGLAIMRERSKNLKGELSVRNHSEGGTCVQFTFRPSSVEQASVFARDR